MASYVCWGRGRNALPAMRQGRGKEEFVQESRRNEEKQTNMFQKKNMMMSFAKKGTKLEQKGAVALISA